MSTLAVNAVTDANGGNTATINSMTPTADSLQGFRNRIINGDMRIDQRNAGAAVTSGYPVDRFQVVISTDGAFSGQQDSSVPAGFNTSVKLTTTTADASLGATQFYAFRHRVEGFNVADLNWGTANAKTVTLSFWTRSSLTGTFGGVLRNSANDRSYPFTYSISSANTWEYKTITVAGDTSGTWLTTNGIGLQIDFGLGVGSTYSGTAGAWAGSLYISATGAVSVIGTLNATWYVTGVQLEVGSVATPFERRPYGAELALCQRYYYKVLPGVGSIPIAMCANATTTVTRAFWPLPVTMRIAPSALEQTGTASDYRIQASNANTTLSAAPTLGTALPNFVRIDCTVASGLTAGQAGSFESNSANGFVAVTAEL
jgi:hypothetical protein